MKYATNATFTSKVTFRGVEYTNTGSTAIQASDGIVAHVATALGVTWHEALDMLCGAEQAGTLVDKLYKNGVEVCPLDHM